MSEVIICHRGMPCDPPIVDGVEFAPHPDEASIYLAAVTEEQAAEFTRIPAFTRFGGITPAMPPRTLPSFQPKLIPVPQWKNEDLIRKATELGLETEGLKRADLITLVSEALKLIKE